MKTTAGRIGMNPLTFSKINKYTINITIDSSLSILTESMLNYFSAGEFCTVYMKIAIYN